MNKNRFITVFLGVVLLTISGIVSCEDPKKCHKGIQLYGDFHPSFSPDGQYIAYVQGGSGLYIIDRDGNNKRLVIAKDDKRLNQPSQDFKSPSWSPNGQWLVFSNGHIFKCKINGDSLTRLTDIDTSSPKFSYPNWSKDNSRIVFHVDFEVCGTYQTNVDFTNSKMLFGPDQFLSCGEDAELSPDATRLVFFGISTVSTYNDIFISDDFGNQKVKLTSNRRNNYYPTWSPDGQKIAWISGDHLSIMNADGTNQREIDSGYFPSFPSWSVNDEIVFCDAVLTSENECTSYYRQYLYVISPDGKNKRQITF